MGIGHEHSTTPVVETDVWRKRFGDLVEFASSLSWFGDRMDFYEGIATALKDVSGAGNVNIRLLTPAQDSFVLYAYHGDLEESTSAEFAVLSANAGRMPRLIETGEPIVFDFANPRSDDVAWDRGVRDGYACAVIVALVGPQGMIGALDFLYREPCDWADDDVAWLCDLGRFAGAVIGNALLTDNVLNLRIADERRNLAVEIHDNVAQSASLISIEAESAFDSLKHHDVDALRRNLDLIRRAGLDVEKSLRGEMRNLRSDTGAGGEDGAPLELLEQMTQAFCAQWGLGCEVESDDEARSTPVAPRVMAQLTRVVNEALVNVVRHARASRVVFECRVSDDRISIAIEDDGCGFSIDEVPPSHLGMRIMRERLDSVGATMRVESALGSGTRVSFDVPYLA